MGVIQSRFSNSEDPIPNEEKEKVVLKIQTEKEEPGADVHTDNEEEVLDIQTPTAGLSFERIFSISEEKVLSSSTPRLASVGLDDITIEEENGVRDEIAEYCLPLIVLHFCGQTSCLNEKDSDQERDSSKLLTLKSYLRMLDKFIRQHKVITQLSGEEEEYRLIIRLIATQRYKKNQESIEDCYQRLMIDSKRFIQIYHKRGEISELLETNSYWGSRQQLLAGKVMADWVDRENGSLDPIFGVLLNPTAGRVGPGDSGWFHDMLFDDRGHWAFHSAVHDAFGYLKLNHDVGPGYNYLDKSSIFHTDDTDSPMAGQLPGIAFWKNVINEIKLKQKVLEHWRL